MATTARVKWQGGATGLVFQATGGSGHAMTFDSGAGQIASNPVEATLAALGACHGMDVISILKKKRQDVTGYEIELTSERRTEHPKSLTKVETLHRVRGRGVSQAALEEAVRLSETRYCSVHASLRADIEFVTRFEVVEESE
jgi:putative redox protein